MSQKCRKQNCLYCDQVLSNRHEHDHMPIPARNGGTVTYCVCVNCHDLKDRGQLMKNPDDALAALSGLWAKANPLERIVIAYMSSQVSDVLQGRPI